jgi:hypothetical protein
MRSTGRGKIIVELFSLLMLVSACRHGVILNGRYSMMD